jgi:hypothetical protein
MSLLVPEKGFPVSLRRAINYLWSLCSSLREVRGVEPIRVIKTEGNLVVYLNEDAQKAVQGLISGTAGNTINAEYWDANTNTVKTADFVVVVPI